MTEGVDTSLLGIGYDSSSGQNFAESIDLATGKETVLASVTFPNNVWALGSFTADGADAFALSSGLLYEIDLTTRAVATLPADNLEGLTFNGSSLLGIGYNSSTEQNFVESIDLSTGQETVLASVVFANNVWSQGSFTADEADAFVLSSGLLYEISLATGAVTAIPVGNLEGLTFNGSSLLGIGYNSSTEQNFIESIDLSTGQETVLASVAFANNVWSQGSFTADGADAFALSSGLLYEINLTTETVTTIPDENLESIVTNLVDDNAPCFLSGTRIVTPRGETPVERLAVGDPVLTHSGVSRPVKWIGYRTIDLRRHPRLQEAWPVRIHANAFGFNSPHRDLWLSPDHAIFADGVLIPVKYLINGLTIVQESRDEVTYYHVELEEHDVILAEGLPCESYLDNGNRSAFANGGSIVQMHPDFAPGEQCEIIWEAKGYAPLCIEGPAVDRLASQLRRRAMKLGYTSMYPSKSHSHMSKSGKYDKVSPNFAQLLQAEWYLANNPDVAAAGISAASHYAQWGQREGRLPCPEIDLVRAFGLPKVDQITSDLGALLQPSWYLANNLDVAAANIDPAVHYANFGRAEGRLPCSEIDLIRALGLIDERTLAIAMGDIVLAKVDPVAHFCIMGWKERRRPNLYFDTAWYLNAYDMPVRTNPLLHYVLYGENQGLKPSRHFDPLWYRQRYALAPLVSPLAHYMAHRRNQNVSPLPVFDIAAYVKEHASTLRPGRDAYVHFLATERLIAMNAGHADPVAA